MEAVEAKKNIKPANDLIKALGIKELQLHYLKHREFFTEDEIKDYYKNFQKFDADKDGKISAADISRVCAKMGEKVDKKKLGDMMQPKKPNENITFDDFLDIMRDVHHGTIPSDKGFAHLYFKGKDLIKFPSEFRLKEISPSFHSTTSDELCLLLCFVNMLLKDEKMEGLIPMDCPNQSELQKLCDGRIFWYVDNMAIIDTFSRLLNKLQQGLVPMDKFCDKSDMNKAEMTENQQLCLTGATNYGCDVKDIEPIDLVNGVEYRLLAVLSQIHQVAKGKNNNLEKQIEDFAKDLKERREKEPKQKGRETKAEKAKPRGERRRQMKQRSGQKKKAAHEVSHFVEGMDPEEFLIGWCNFHLKKFQMEINNLGPDLIDGTCFCYLINSLNNSIINHDLLNHAKKLALDEADKRGEIIIDAAKKMGLKLDITPVDIIKGDYLINFAFINQLYNLHAASKQHIQDVIKMQNECLNYIIKNINDLEDLEILMEEEINTLKDNVDNLEDSLAGVVGELLVDEIAAMTGMPLPSLTMGMMEPSDMLEEVSAMIPPAPPLPGTFQGAPAGRRWRDESMKQQPAMIQPMQQPGIMQIQQPAMMQQMQQPTRMPRMEEAIIQTEMMEDSIQSQMMDLMQQVKNLMSAQQQPAAAQPVIPATIKSEVEQATRRKSEIQAPEKEGLAYMKGVLKWKPCRLIMKDNRLLVFKAGRDKPSEDIYLSEAIKISQENVNQGYYAIRLTLSFTDSVILGWTDEFLMREWFAFLSTKIRPTLTTTDFVMSGQRVVPQATTQYQRVPIIPSVKPIPTGEELLKAVEEGDIPLVRNMLDRGADPLITNAWGGNCLHIAAAYGNKDMTKFLTDYFEAKGLIKFLIDQPTAIQKNTPLHLAVKAGDAKLCQMLLDKGASKELKNELQETPIELSNSRGNLDVMAIFAPPAAPPAPAMPQGRSHPFLIHGAPMAAYRPQMTASQSPYILPSSSPYYRYRTQPF